MKVTNGLFLVFLVSVLACGIAASPKKIYRIPPQASEKIVEEVLKCVQKMGLDSTVVNLLKEGKYTEDDRVIETLMCSNQNVGNVNGDGKVNIDKVMNDIFSNKPEIRSALVACEKDGGKSPLETFKNFILCFKEKVPVKVML
ncbi:uncharacterized protein LOC115441722 [Manduca sexta]|uniref:Antennal binding protein 6 n=1 Tax=Manduca sexta TaxID=7130 RepID=Q8WRW0_MANSE|nr:uncharacterized protein LOC115441722 [Manduca sexta]AAL60424.1 antennal binding protein 6 [Manduca sexta]